MQGTEAWQAFQDYQLWDIAVSWGRAPGPLRVEIESNGKLRSLDIHRGNLLAATSEEPSENLIQVFLDAQKFTLEQYFQVSGGFDEEKSTAENLLASGLVTPAEVTAGRRECMFRILKGSLLLQSGAFRTFAPALEEAQHWVPLLPALFRAFLLFEDREWVLRQYDQHLHIGIKLEMPFPESLWETPEMTSFESIAEKCDQGILFRELAHTTTIPEFMLLKFLWLGTQLGYLSRSMVLESMPTDAEAIASEKITHETPKEQALIGSQPGESSHGSSRRLWWMFLLLVATGAAAAIWYFLPESNPALNTQKEQPTEAFESGVPTRERRPPKEPDVSSRSELNPGQLALERGDVPAAAAYWKTALAKEASSFTLGIYMVCDPENVSVLWRSLHESDDFFVLPKTFQGENCYWACWGVFASRLEALSARETLPPGILQIAPDADAYVIEKLQ